MKKNVNLAVKISVWAVAVLAVVVCVSISVWSAVTRPLTSEQNELSVHYTVPSGTSVKKVASELKEQKIIRSDKAFYAAAKFNLYTPGTKFSLKSGTYTLKSSMSLKKIYMILQEGKQETVSVSIAEGLTISKIGELLEESGVCKKTDFISSAKDSKWSEKIGISVKNCEGFLFPDTYYFTYNMDADNVVSFMIDNFKEKIKTVNGYENLSGQQFYEKIILASIVEREYRAADEAPVIAGVFINRLNRKMGLESCATVEYIISEIQGKPHPKKIYFKDLEINSPYNTYKYAGLPPAPISNPGLVALNAAFNPEKTDYIYFVLTDPTAGRHTFTKTFDEHLKAKSIYVTK